MNGMSVKNKVVRLTGPGVEYPALGGKVIRQARFENDEDYTALSIEFVDDTLVSFRLKASVAFSTAPELSTLKGGNIVSWKELRPRPVMKRMRRK